MNQYWVLDWGNTGALACMLQKDTAKIASITDVCKGKSAIDGVFNCVSDWGLADTVQQSSLPVWYMIS